jgi:hypothetical protein
VINPPNFGRQPKLYLELLENKQKVKPSLRNVEFTPSYAHEEQYQKSRHDQAPKDTDAYFPEEKSRERPQRYTDKSRKPSRPQRDDLPPKSDFPSKGKDTREEKGRLSRQVSQRDPSRKPPDKEESKDDAFDAPPPDEVLPDSFGDDPLAKVLRKSASIGHHRPENGRAEYEKQKEDLLRDTRKLPPSLQEIEEGGAFEQRGVKNMDRVGPKDQDKEQKLREYIFKFKLLREAYKGEDIPTFTMSSDLDYVSKTYDNFIQNLNFNGKVGKYKQMLMYGFMGTELVLGNMMGFDMKGFTKQQVMEMGAYEVLLIELGEKNHLPKSEWPVEMRLLSMIVMNAAFFIFSRMAFNSIGTDVMKGAQTAAAAVVAPIQPKKNAHMRGPTINLDNIPDPPSEAKPEVKPEAKLEAKPSASGLEFVGKK